MAGIPFSLFHSPVVKNKVRKVKPVELLNNRAKLPSITPYAQSAETQVPQTARPQIAMTDCLSDCLRLEKTQED